jgi:hypothetical protein
MKIGKVYNAGTSRGPQAVDKQDVLHEHRIGGALGELCRREFCAVDAVAGHPLHVDVGEELHGCERV